MIYDSNGPDYKPGQGFHGSVLKTYQGDVRSGSWIPDKGKDEFMVTGECIRKWIGISYLMVLYMGEHDTKELANSKIFNHSVFTKLGQKSEIFIKI